MEIPANKVIDRLKERVGELELEKVILQVQVDELAAQVSNLTTESEVAE